MTVEALHGVRFLDFVPCFVGTVPVKLARISFTGERGYELWTPSAYLPSLYEQIAAPSARGSWSSQIGLVWPRSSEILEPREEFWVVGDRVSSDLLSI